MAENAPLEDWLDKPVSELVELEPLSIPAGQQQRDRIYLLLLMALVYHYRNGHKEGKAGRYPYNENQHPESFQAGDSDGEHLGGDYLGHNIAALAVEGDGRVIDFDFNHNELLNSSVEHAESRLIRRVFSLAHLHDTWNVASEEKKSRWAARDDYPTFNNVTVYTSLESCAQCAGIMTLGKVWRVVYLQSDPGAKLIGNILHNLERDAPLPISTDNVGSPYFKELNEAFKEFGDRVKKEEPFFVPKDSNKKPDKSASPTSFLCTKMAQDIFGRGTLR